jgi:hypothetical protein
LRRAHQLSAPFFLKVGTLRFFPPTRYDLAFPRRDAPGVCVSLSLEKTEGAGKAGCPLHPQPLCIGRWHRVVTTSTPEITRLSPRHGFNGFLRALLGDEFLLPPSPADMACLNPVGPTRLRRLGISNGCQDHTTSPSAAPRAKNFQRAMCRSRQNFGEGEKRRSSARRCPLTENRPANTSRAPDAAASIASHPAFPDDHDTPLLPGWDGASL